MISRFLDAALIMQLKMDFVVLNLKSIYDPHSSKWPQTSTTSVPVIQEDY